MNVQRRPGRLAAMLLVAWALPTGTVLAADPPATPTSPYVRPAPVQWQPPPTTVDLSSLPKDSAGRPVLAGTPDGTSLVLEKQKQRTVANVAAICSTWVTHCYAPGQRSLDQCWVSMPRCRTADGLKDTEPCCPGACFERYEALRKRSASPLAATDGALFGEGNCLRIPAAP